MSTDLRQAALAAALRALKQIAAMDENATRADDLGRAAAIARAALAASPSSPCAPAEPAAQKVYGPFYNVDDLMASLKSDEPTAEPAAQGGERSHAICRMCGGTGAGGGDSEWCTHCGATGREPSKVDEQTLMALWDETATRDDRVLAFGFAVAEHVALVCRMDGA